MRYDALLKQGRYAMEDALDVSPVVNIVGVLLSGLVQ